MYAANAALRLTGALMRSTAVWSLSALVAHAQSAPSPATPALSPPAACLKAANDARVAKMAPFIAAMRSATEATRADVQAKYQAAAVAELKASQETALQCSAQFSVATIPVTQLPDLVSLLTFARDTANVRRASDRLMSDPTLPPRTRAQALIINLDRAIGEQSDHFGILDRAEKVIAQIDALPDSLSEFKARAHTSMMGRYEYLDVAAGLEQHARALLAMPMTAAQSQTHIMAYQSLARSFADRLRPDSALRILDAGERALGAPAVAQFADFRHRYQLIGTAAPRVEAAWWINTKQTPVITPQAGVVTLVEFTAHWCGPCKNSYPGLRAVAERFKGKPFAGVMVTQLYGYIGAQKNLTPEQEVAADQAYFGTEHALPFPVAINSPAKPVGNTFVQPKPDTDYRVSGIPQIMIIDKHGIIRQIVTGWDQGNTERFSAFIEQLLAEK